MFGPGFCIYTVLTTRGHHGDGCRIVLIASTDSVFHEASICPPLLVCVNIPQPQLLGCVG